MFPIIRYGSEEANIITSDKNEILRKIKQNAKNRTKSLKRNANVLEKSADAEVPAKIPSSIITKNESKIDGQLLSNDADSATKNNKSFEHPIASVVDEEDLKRDNKVNKRKYDPLEMFKMGLKSPKFRKDIFIEGDLKLPEWIENPFWIETDVNSTANFDLTGFEQVLQENLKEMGIEQLFPVQTSLIPALLFSTTCDLMSRPNDICVCSPTGSGKTLAFAIPIVNFILKSPVSGTCALVVVPTVELAKQVHSVFDNLSRGGNIKCVLLGGGQIHTESQLLRKHTKFGIDVFPDIIVSTPGRLSHFIETPEILRLDKLRFLVIDEADRILDLIKQSWLQKLKQLLVEKEQNSVANMTLEEISKPNKAVQKLLFSATLSTDPEQLKSLNLFRPRLFIAKSPTSKDNNVVNTTKYITPPTLHEYIVRCEANLKPLIVVGLLTKLKVKKALCFAGTVESARRLHLLMNEYVKSNVLNISCIEFSSLLTKKERKRNMNEFNAKKECVLVCSDAAARGIDAIDVEMVVLYDSPQFIEAYIHRAGRASRAGREGSVYSLVTESEIGHFKKVLKTAGKGLPEDFVVGDDIISNLSQNYETILSNVQQVLQSKKT